MPLAKPLVLALLLAHAPTVASAQSPRVDAAAIIGYGIYTDRVTDKLTSEATPQGYINIVTDVKLVETTTTICARLGLGFGVEYRLIGEPHGTTVPLEMVTRYPPQGLTHPSRGHRTESRYPSTPSIGVTSYRGITFDASWEIEPGTWTLEFYHAGRKIGEKAFEVYRQCPIS